MKLFGFFLLSLSIASFAREIKLPKLIYQPLFKDPGETHTVVGPLHIDQTPVTNSEFLKFIRAYPQFSKSKVTSLFADTGYLSHWTSDTSFLKTQAQYPVTYVSWFVARRFCESKGKRLPTIAEWEVASDSQNPRHEAEILEWFSKPGAKLRAVGMKASNKYGLKDPHGLIWEWVDNFSESIMSGDSRGGSSTESMFCGGAALKAKDPRLYAAFIRFAFRSSLNSKYTSANLGFRCVREIKDVTK